LFALLQLKVLPSFVLWTHSAKPKLLPLDFERFICHWQRKRETAAKFFHYYAVRFVSLSHRYAVLDSNLAPPTKKGHRLG